MPLIVSDTSASLTDLEIAARDRLPLDATRAQILEATADMLADRIASYKQPKWARAFWSKHSNLVAEMAVECPHRHDDLVILFASVLAEITGRVPAQAEWDEIHRQTIAG